MVASKRKIHHNPPQPVNAKFIFYKPMSEAMSTHYQWQSCSVILPLLLWGYWTYPCVSMVTNIDASCSFQPRHEYIKINYFVLMMQTRLSPCTQSPFFFSLSPNTNLFPGFNHISIRILPVWVRQVFLCSQRRSSPLPGKISPS